jgi:hypothetical protein
MVFNILVNATINNTTTSIRYPKTIDVAFNPTLLAYLLHTENSFARQWVNKEIKTIDTVNNIAAYMPNILDEVYKKAEITVNVKKLVLPGLLWV